VQENANPLGQNVGKLFPGETSILPANENFWHAQCDALQFRKANAFKISINQRSPPMLRLAIALLLLSLLFAVFGFGGIAASFAGVAKILFWVFIVLFAISAVASVLRGKTPAI